MSAVSTAKFRSVQDWESKFTVWAKGPGQTEQNKCENAERMVRDAINAHPAFKNRNIRVFLQGSYRNRTNVRMDSDVDICVLCMDAFVGDYSHVPGVNASTLGFINSPYKFDNLKKDVYDALVAKFGVKAVTPGDKAFDIKENTYRVSADVVPTFEGRLYYRDNLGQLRYHSGTVLESAKNKRTINNWPEQHYNNGVSKHTQTSRQFKKKVRCLKNLSNEMASFSIASAESMASFLLESLVYNCPDNLFGYDSHYDDMKAVIAYLWNLTKTDDTSKNMVEVNAIKYLFHDSQPWNRSQAHTFLLDAWHYVGFAN
ncbi:MAG TPA: nucleotidyltransferase [Herpetosiphonaceae bacterium]